MSNGIKNNFLSECVDSCYVTDHQLAYVEQTTSRHVTSCDVTQHKEDNNMFDAKNTNIIHSSEERYNGSTDDFGHGVGAVAIEGQTVNPPHLCRPQSEDDISIVASAASTTTHNATKQNTTFHVQCDVTNKQEDHAMINKTHGIANTAVDMTFGKFNRDDGMALLKSLSGHTLEQTISTSAYWRIDEFIRAWNTLTPITICSEDVGKDELGHFIPARNEIHVRSRLDYTTDAEYFKVIFHEIIHSCVFLMDGEIALNRDSYDYHRNEICAEMGAMVLLNHFGIDVSDIKESVVEYCCLYSQLWDPAINAYRTIKLRDLVDEILDLVDMVLSYANMAKSDELEILNKQLEEETEMANKTLSEVSTMKNEACLNGLNMEEADKLTSRVFEALYSEEVCLRAHGLMAETKTSCGADDYVNPKIDEVIEFWSANVAEVRFLKTRMAKHSDAFGLYSPIFNTISCLGREFFPTAVDFYHTVLHEMVHSYDCLTHDQQEWASQEDAKLYARGEIYAELGGLLLMSYLGTKITKDIIDDTAVYIYGYLCEMCSFYSYKLESEFNAVAKETIELVNGMIELFAFIED